VVISTGEQLLSEPQPKPSTLTSMGEALCRQGERMLNLVNQLLDIAKIRSEMQQEDWRHGDIVAYMKMLVSSFQPQAEKCQVELRYSPAESRVDMDFVPDYMIKVFSNLISNAFKFTPSHGHVYISSHVENEHIQFQVADNGMGISEEDIDHIFDEFYQGSEGPSTIGTGIGLALVKSIVTTVGGEIQVESPQRKGTIFTLSFPLRHGSEKLKQLDSDLIPKDVLHPKMSEDKFGEIEGSPENAPIVLIVDDEPDVSYYIGLQLKNHYRLYYAKDGQEGIEKAKEILPDLIITDLLMPRRDGFELCRAVRSSELLDHIAVVVLSARGGDEDRIKALAARVPTNQPNWEHYLHTWLLGMVAHWQGRKSLTGNALVPLLIGRQGCGKSSFCRILLPKELRDYYNDRINFKNETDLNLGLTSFALINIDEFDKTTARQQVLLKYLLSTADVKFRPPYGKAYKQYRRYASFIGTTNQPKPLTDPTGSRRFVCVEVTDMINFSDDLDHYQIYAQLKAEIEQGMKYWLDDDEIARLIDENERFQRIDSLEEMIAAVFRKPEEGEAGHWFSATEVLEKLQARYGKTTLKNYSPEKIGTRLSSRHFAFESDHKRKGNCYLMVER
jgi:CheY-like chemotaxis protein/two-component sensor histidine kinase